MSVSTFLDHELSLRTFPCTTACSPKTITFPGAETMKAGIIGDDCLRFNCERGLEAGSSSPLICTRFTPLLSSSSWEGMSDVGDNDGVLQIGVVMMWLTELIVKSCVLVVVLGNR